MFYFGKKFFCYFLVLFVIGSFNISDTDNSITACRYRILWPVKADNMLWWASVLMFIGATGFNISNIALVLLGDIPLDLTTSQEVCALTFEL